MWKAPVWIHRIASWLKWDIIIPCRAESVNVFGPVSSATKIMVCSHGSCDQALRVFKASGEELIAVCSEEVEIIGNVRNLKHRLESLCGMPRFRQRLLKDEEILGDDAGLEPGDFQLLLLHFCKASGQQVRLLGRYARDGEGKRVEEMLMLPQNPDSMGSLGMTPLCLAAQAGHGRVVELLLEASADKNRACGWATPLRVAAQEGHAEIVRRLLEARAETEGCSQARGDTPLGLAANEGHREVVRLLLEAQADSNKGGPVYTPLGLAITSGRPDLQIVRLLLEAGADQSVCGDLQAAEMAMVSCRWDIVDLLQSARKGSCDSCKV